MLLSREYLESWASMQAPAQALPTTADREARRDHRAWEHQAGCRVDRPGWPEGKRPGGGLSHIILSLWRLPKSNLPRVKKLPSPLARDKPICIKPACQEISAVAADGFGPGLGRFLPLLAPHPLFSPAGPACRLSRKATFFPSPLSSWLEHPKVSVAQSRAQAQAYQARQKQLRAQAREIFSPMIEEAPLFQRGGFKPFLEA